MRKIIDDRGRLFGLISFIDIFVLIVAAILVIAFLVRGNIYTPMTTVNTTNVTYTVMVPSVRDTSANLLRPGDGLYNRENGIRMGTITAVDTEPATTLIALIDGTAVMGPVEDRLDVFLTVETDASFSNGRFYASRIIELNANANYPMFTKFNTFNGMVTWISGDA